MSPEMKDVTCILCEEVKDKNELERYDGMCFDCAQAMQEADEKVDAREPSGDAEGADDPELRKTVDAYRKRQEYMKEYNSRPDIIERRKAYMKGRQEKIKMLLRKAKDAGLLEDKA